MDDSPASGGATESRLQGSDVGDAIDRICDCVGAISLDFGRWGEPRVQGPGLYFVILEGDAAVAFAEPMGENRWPVEDCPSVFEDPDRLFRTARAVGANRDGAVLVDHEGRIAEPMVRLDDLSSAGGSRVASVSFAGWMGARHMSALETSTRDGVAVTITLSEEDGRVTVFADGRFEDFERDRLSDGRRPSLPHPREDPDG